MMGQFTLHQVQLFINHWNLISSFWTSEGWVQLNVEDAKDVSMVTN